MRYAGYNTPYMARELIRKDIEIGATPAYYSYPNDSKTHPGLIVIHEIWGLVDHIKNVADRFAAEGYSVLAPNLFYGLSFEGKVDQGLLEEMGDPSKRDEAQKKMRALLVPIQAPKFSEKTITKLKECTEYLLSDVHVDGHVGVLGFCFGGTYSFALAATEKRIEAAVPFYGQPPAQDSIPLINCPVLALYGEQDINLINSLPQLKDSMHMCNKNFEAVVYPHTGHAFFNDTNIRMYNAEAAKDAWERTLAFLAQHLT